MFYETCLLLYYNLLRKQMECIEYEELLLRFIFSSLDDSSSIKSPLTTKYAMCDALFEYLGAWRDLSLFGYFSSPI